MAEEFMKNQIYDLFLHNYKTVNVLTIAIDLRQESRSFSMKH